MINLIKFKTKILGLELKVFEKKVKLFPQCFTIKCIRPTMDNESNMQKSKKKSTKETWIFDLLYDYDSWQSITFTTFLNLIRDSVGCGDSCFFFCLFCSITSIAPNFSSTFSYYIWRVKNKIKDNIFIVLIN